MRVVEMSFLIVIEDFVGLTDGLELDLCLRPLILGDLVWMARERCLVIGESNRLFSGLDVSAHTL